MSQQTVPNSWFEKNENFFQSKQRFHNKSLQNIMLKILGTHWLVVCCFFSAHAQLVKQNIIKNGSFEITGSHKNLNELSKKSIKVSVAKGAWARGWFIQPAISKGGGEVNIIAKNPQDGKRCLMIKTLGIIRVIAPGAGKAGSTYKLTLWAKKLTDVSGNVVVINLNKYNTRKFMGTGGGTEQNIISLDGNEKGEWVKLKVPIKVEDIDVKVFTIMLGIKGEMCIDNLSLTLDDSNRKKY